MVLILVCIIILNIIALALAYYCLSDLEKKDRIIFIAVCVAGIYMLTSFVYWISTKGVAVKAVSDLGKKLITFLFVPINTIAVVPLLAKSYNKYKTGFLAGDKFRNRCIVLAVFLLIILSIECVYFKNVQNTVITLIEKNQQSSSSKEELLNNMIENTVVNAEKNNIANVVSNDIANIISDNTVNSVDKSIVY